MSEIQNNPLNEEEYEDEIDFLAIFKRLLQKKVFIAKVAVICAVAAVFVAAVSPKKYKAECVFFPQSSNDKSGGTLSSLAALAGVNLGSVGSGQSVISPNLYPVLMKNDKFIKDLMYSEIYFPSEKRFMSLYDFYTDSSRRRTSVAGTVLKYTVGLPGVIMKAVRGGDDRREMSVDFLDTTSIVVLSPKERMCASVLKGDVVELEIDQKKSNITLTSRMDDPYLAAQMAQVTFELLQRYIVQFRTQKAQLQYDYIDKLTGESKIVYDSLLNQYSKFQDSHRSLTSKVAGTDEVRLKNQYEMVKGIYFELCGQREQAKVRVKEDTPVLTVIKPVTVQNRPANMGKSKVMAIAFFVGMIIASGLVLFFDFLKNNGMAYPAGWHNQEEDDEAERKILESGLVPDSFWKKFFSKKLFV